MNVLLLLSLFILILINLIILTVIVHRLVVDWHILPAAYCWYNSPVTFFAAIMEKALVAEAAAR